MAVASPGHTRIAFRWKQNSAFPGDAQGRYFSCQPLLLYCCPTCWAVPGCASCSWVQDGAQSILQCLSPAALLSPALLGTASRGLPLVPPQQVPPRAEPPRPSQPSLTAGRERGEPCACSSLRAIFKTALHCAAREPAGSPSSTEPGVRGAPLSAAGAGPRSGAPARPRAAAGGRGRDGQGRASRRAAAAGGLRSLPPPAAVRDPPPDPAASRTEPCFPLPALRKLRETRSGPAAPRGRGAGRPGAGGRPGERLWRGGAEVYLSAEFLFLFFAIIDGGGGLLLVGLFSAPCQGRAAGRGQTQVGSFAGRLAVRGGWRKAGSGHPVIFM